jgi:hypothetical protein
MKKPFKETKLGKIVTEKLPQVASVVGDLLPDSGVLGVVKNAIDMATISPNEKKELLEAHSELELEVYKLDIEDRGNARNMQIEALKQSDNFSKRFIYFFSAFWSVFSALYLGGITFCDVPTNSIRIVDTVLGFILGTAITMMFSYFYGSSAGAAKRNDTVYDLIKK